MLNKFIVSGLHGNKDIEIDFEPDLTVITGENGCGKTTALKLMWYLLSPNIERAYREIDFSEAFLQTDLFSISFSKEKCHVVFNPGDSEAEMIIGGESEVCCDDNLDFMLSSRLSRGRTEFEFELELVNNSIRKLQSSSLFFPTYRRIEENDRFSSEEMRRLSSAIRDYSQRVSVDNHRLVASVSTKDIKDLITSKYAELSEEALSLRGDLLNEIVLVITNTKKGNEGAALKALATIRSDIECAEGNQKELFSSFDMMKEAVGHFMRDKAVRISNNICIGEINRVIGADKLSAGEKQILSFLAYNALYKDTPIIIDEPELSLHIDWQRELVPMLLGQETSNQIILATHSPFIYSKYPDKEINLSR